MKKDLGILTLQKVYNFGATLQVFALQWKLGELGVRADIIDIEKHEILELEYKKKYKLFGFFLFRIRKGLSALKNLLLNIYYFKDFRLNLLSEIQLSFDEFESRYLTFSRVFKFEDELDVAFNKIVVGSDQVWNPGLAYDTNLYFLKNSSRVNKYSFAASFGVKNLPENRLVAISNALEKFRYVSVRESFAINQLSERVKRESLELLDPIFLFSKEQWVHKLGLTITPGMKDKYILSYTLGSELDFSEQVCLRVSKELGLKVVSIGRSRLDIGKSNDVLWGIGPKEFLELILNAEILVTNSFHGISFAINFGIPFVALKLSSSERFGRIENVVNKFGLEHRIISKVSDLDEIHNLQSIDYSDIMNRRELELKRSEEFLNLIIND